MEQDRKEKVPVLEEVRDPAAVENEKDADRAEARGRAEARDRAKAADRVKARDRGKTGLKVAVNRKAMAATKISKILFNRGVLRCQVEIERVRWEWDR